MFTWLNSFSLPLLRNRGLFYPYAVPKREGDSRYKLPGSGGPERGPGPHYFAYVFVFLYNIILCRLYTVTLSEQAPNSATASLSDLM